MKAPPILLFFLTLALALTTGCISSSVKGSNPHGSRYARTELEYELRMAIYLRALNDCKWPLSAERALYIEESDQFIAELNRKAGSSTFRQLNRTLFGRMRSGTWQEPGLCLLITFSKLTETYAEGDLLCHFASGKHICGCGYYFRMEKRNGEEWSLDWTIVVYT